MQIKKIVFVLGILLLFLGGNATIGYCQKTAAERNDLAVIYGHGINLMQWKQYNAAIGIFDKYSASTNNNDVLKVEAYYQAAFGSLQLFRPDAEKRYLDIINNYPEHSRAVYAYFDLGTFYYQQKNYEKTIKYLSKPAINTLALNQKYEAKFKLGYAYLSKKDFVRADSAFGAIKNTEHNYTAAANYYASYLNVRAGKYNDAFSGLDKADKDPAFRGMTPQLRVIIHYKRKEYSQVIAVGEKALKDTSKINGVDEIALLVAESHYVKENYAKADSNFHLYLSKSKATNLNATLRYRIAYAEFMNGNNEMAIGNFKMLAAKSGNDSASVGKKDTLSQFSGYYLAMAYLKTGEKQNALAALASAKQGTAMPNAMQEQAWFNYGKLQFDLGQFEDALSTFKVYNDKFPYGANEAEAADLLSEAYLATPNYDEALAYIGKIKKRTKRTDAAYQRVAFLKGAQLYNDGSMPEASEYLKSSLAVPSDTGVTIAAHYWLAETEFSQKKYIDAIANYQTVLRNKEGKSSQYGLKATYGLAYALYNNKEYAKALGIFDQYVKVLEKEDIRQNYADALVRLADCHYAGKGYNTAIKIYRQAIETKVPEADYCYYQIGLIYTLLGEDENAKTAFGQLALTYPQSRYRDAAAFQKANIDFERSNYTAAVTGFGNVITSATDANTLVYSYLKRALAYNNLKDYSNASSDFKKIIDSYPTHKAAEEAIQGLQEAATRSGNIEDFNEYLQKYKKGNPDDKSLENIEFTTARSLFYTQKYDKAIIGLESYITNYPTNLLAADAKYYLAESNYRLGKKDVAVVMHKEVLAENKSPNVAKSIGRLAEINLAEGKYDTAEVLLRSGLRLAKSKKEVLLTRSSLLDACFGQQKYDSTLVLADAILSTQGAGQDLLNKAALYKAKVALSKGEAVDAKDLLLAVLNDANDVNGAEAKYLLAELQYNNKEYKQSIETLFGLNKAFSAYTKWYDKSFLLLADNYVALNDTYQATYALNSLIEKTKSNETKDAAKAKLADIASKKGQ